MTRHRSSRFLASLFLAALFSLTGATAWAGNLFGGPINSPAGKYPWAIAAGDFNGDGKVDVAVTNNSPLGSGGVKVLLGEGNGIFGSPTGYRVGDEPLSLAAGDFNRDDNLDLAVVSLGDSPKSLDVLLANGDGTFQPRVRYKSGIGSFQVAVGDFNGDGKPDLAVTNSGDSKSGFVSVLLGNGDGTFQPRIKTLVGHHPSLIAASDVNGDGEVDLVVASSNVGPKPRITALLGNGDGTFKVAWSATGRTPTGIALGDFNGDGKLDLVETEIAGSRVRIRLGRGDGTFRKPVDYSVNCCTAAIAVADFDGDQKLDVAVINGLGVSVLLGKGDGTFGSATNYALSPTADPIEMVAVDVNGDQRPDLVVTDHFNKVVSVLVNTGHK